MPKARNYSSFFDTNINAVCIHYSYHKPFKSSTSYFVYWLTYSAIIFIYSMLRPKNLHELQKYIHIQENLPEKEQRYIIGFSSQSKKFSAWTKWSRAPQSEIVDDQYNFCKITAIFMQNFDASTYLVLRLWTESTKIDKTGPSKTFTKNTKRFCLLLPFKFSKR